LHKAWNEEREEVQRFKGVRVEEFKNEEETRRRVAFSVGLEERQAA
jgi:hypothetical protein